MMRLLELVFLALLIWMVLEALATHVRARLGRGPTRGVRPPGRGPQRSDKPAELLVRCAACGTHVPRSRALAAPGDDALYCSDRCRRQARAQAG